MRGATSPGVHASGRIVVLLTFTAFAFTTNCFPPLVTTISERLSVNIQLFGWLFTLQFSVFAASAFVSTWVQRRTRVSNRTMVLAGLAIISVAFLSAPVLKSRAALYVLIVLLGAAGGLVESHGSVIVSEINPRRSSQYLNLSQAFYCVGGIVAPYTVGLLLRRHLRWQDILALFGLIIVAVLVAFARRGGSRPPSPEAEPLRRAHSTGAASSDPPRHPKYGAIFFLLSLMMFLYTFSESTLVSWLPSLVQLTRGLSPSSAAGALGMFWLGVMATRFAMFYFPERASLTTVIVSALVLSLTALAALWLSRGGAWVDPAALVAGFAFGPVWPSIVAVTRAGNSRGSLTVRVVAIGGLGAAAGPVTSSEVIRLFHIGAVQPLLLCLVVLELGVFGLVLAVRGRRGRYEGAMSSSRG